MQQVRLILAVVPWNFGSINWHNFLFSNSAPLLIASRSKSEDGHCHTQKAKWKAGKEITFSLFANCLINMIYIHAYEFCSGMFKSIPLHSADILQSIFKWIYRLFNISKYFLTDFRGTNNHFLESFQKHYGRTVVFNEITSTYSERRWPWSQHPGLNCPRQIWPTGHVQQLMYNLKARSSHRIFLPACLWHSLHGSPGNLWCSPDYVPSEMLCFNSSRRALACTWLAHTSECGLPGH